MTIIENVWLEGASLLGRELAMHMIKITIRMITQTAPGYQICLHIYSDQDFFSLLIFLNSEARGSSFAHHQSQ